MLRFKGCVFSGCDPSWPFHGTLKGTKGQYKARIRWRSGSEREVSRVAHGPRYKIILRRRPDNVLSDSIFGTLRNEKMFLQKTEKVGLTQTGSGRNLKAGF